MSYCIRHKESDIDNCTYATRLSKEFGFNNPCEECEYNIKNLEINHSNECKFCKALNKSGTVEYDVRQSYTGEIEALNVDNVSQIRVYGESADPSILLINYCPICGRKLK